MAEPIDSIDRVIARLSEILAQAKAERSRLGYFPALYRKVTESIKQGIADGIFDDGARMERLDILFAQRYLDAYGAYRAGGSPVRSWQYAFEATAQRWPIVLQHLLLAINAHINLDLGIAAARTVESPDRLPALRGDFDRINEILARLVGGVKDELAQIWMTLRLLNRYLGRVEDSIINFSLKKSREYAWSVAETLVPLRPEDQERAISELDAKALKLARLVRHPGVVGGTVTKIIRLGERGSIPRIIDILS